MEVEIRMLAAEDWADWVRLRKQLWPDESLSELIAEAQGIYTRLEEAPVFVAVSVMSGELCGFVEVSMHDHVEGCLSMPVGYIEGWYVSPLYRRQGVGKRLIAVAESWAKEKGCREMASDTTDQHPISPWAHRSLGYLPMAKPLHYKKTLL